jgi:hypothetical protein
MSGSYAKGKKAFGFSDRSGFRYLLKDLVPQFENQHNTGLLVGKDEVDEDHPQWQLGKVDASDPQSLQNPRPDTAETVSRGLSAWNPVGGGVTVLGSRTVGLDMSAAVGKVAVT